MTSVLLIVLGVLWKVTLDKVLWSRSLLNEMLNEKAEKLL